MPGRTWDAHHVLCPCRGVWGQISQGRDPPPNLRMRKHARSILRGLACVATMAKRLSFYCDLCDKSYDFRSRYDRHLLSSTHRDLEGAIKLQRFSVPETQSDPCLLPSSTTESRSVSGIPVSLSSTQRRWHKMCTPSTG